MRGLKTYYRVQGDFGAEDLEREVYAVRNDADLIVVDHLHYMDLDDDENENRAMKLLVKKLRDLALVVGIPIVVVAHLRKGTGRPLIPSLEDFHGSSDIVKIATTAILFGPAREVVSSDSRTTGGATFMHVAKCRVDGSRTGEVGLAFFDYEQGRYRDAYAIGRMNGSCTNWTALTGGSKPHWAKNATIEDVSIG